MNNFDRLQVNSLKNDGEIWWDAGAQNHMRKGLSYGTLTGGGFHHFHVFPYQLENATHIHIYGDINGKDLDIQLNYEGAHHPEFWNVDDLDGKELFITTHSSTNSANSITLYWSAIAGPKLLDTSDMTTYKNHGILVNWFNGDAYATHLFSKP